MPSVSPLELFPVQLPCGSSIATLLVVLCIFSYRKGYIFCCSPSHVQYLLLARVIVAKQSAQRAEGNVSGYIAYTNDMKNGLDTIRRNLILRFKGSAV